MSSRSGLDHRVIVVGAGCSGIAMAIRLRALGVEDFVVLERGNDLGGVWRDNSYPGAAGNVPADQYAYSFAPNPDWTRRYPAQAEIWDYLRECVDRFDVAAHLHYDREVEHARWDGEAQRWEVRVAGGTLYRGAVLIWAAGPFGAPFVPELPGRESFRGKVFHSGRWEHGYDLKGKRVGVVGTGTSAVQFVPRLVPVAAHLVVYQRTPPWVVPRHDRPVSRLRRATSRRLPALQKLARRSGAPQCGSALPELGGAGPRHATALRAVALAHLARQVPDDALRAKLTPRHEPGSRPVLRSDDYFPSLMHPEVELVASAAASFTAHEVVAEDGIARPADVVVMATGFAAGPTADAARIVGRDGAPLSGVWSRDGASAYLGLTVTGFPNLFFVLGPDSMPVCSSVLPVIEAQVDYIAAALRFMERPGVREIEVKAAVARRFAARAAPDAIRTGAFRRATRHFHPGEYTVSA